MLIPIGRIVGPISMIMFGVACTTDPDCPGDEPPVASGDEVPLKEAKLNIEHNATDLDTGFQGAIDSEGWSRLDVTGPNGALALTLKGRGTLETLGVTELFFETVEPENAEVPLDDMLARLPAGDYTIEGPSPDGTWAKGTALLTHDIPNGPALVAPVEGAIVPVADLLIDWDPVTTTIDGNPVEVIAYQLIVEKDEEPNPHMIGKRGLSMYLGPTVTSMRVPSEFLEPATPYLWEVLAIEPSGNQTLSSSEFSTE